MTLRWQRGYCRCKTKLYQCLTEKMKLPLPVFHSWSNWANMPGTSYGGNVDLEIQKAIRQRLVNDHTNKEVNLYETHVFHVTHTFPFFKKVWNHKLHVAGVEPATTCYKSSWYSEQDFLACKVHTVYLFTKSVCLCEWSTEKDCSWWLMHPKPLLK